MLRQVFEAARTFVGDPAGATQPGGEALSITSRPGLPVTSWSDLRAANLTSRSSGHERPKRWHLPSPPVPVPTPPACFTLSPPLLGSTGLVEPSK